jgi:hypothetical protein
MGAALVPPDEDELVFDVPLEHPANAATTNAAPTAPAAISRFITALLFLVVSLKFLVVPCELSYGIIFVTRHRPLG